MGRVTELRAHKHHHYFDPLAGGDNLYPVGPDCRLYHDYGLGNAVDYSIYGNDGVITGATFSALGLDFVTDDKVTVAASASLRPVDAVSVYIWLCVNSFTTFDSFVNAGSNGGAWNKGYILWYFGSGSQGMLFGINGYTNAATEISNPSTGTWYFYAGTYNKVEIAEYRNTVKTAVHREYSGDIVYKNPVEDLLIGYGVGGNYVNATIGQVLIFNSGKTQTDIDDFNNFTKARYGL